MRTYRLRDIPELWDYIQMVREGEYPACRDQLLLCDYLERAFERELIRVDRELLGRYLRQQQYFPFRLFEWQRFLFALHNCTFREDGMLRWPVLFCMVGRGAGKNGYIDFEAFCWTTPVNGIKGYHVDIFATSEKQARTSFDDVWELLEDHKGTMERYFVWNKEEILNKKTRSKIRYNTSGHKTKDGGRPGAVIFDEYHAYENYKMIDVATTGLGKKALPRRTIITTDGNVRGGPLDDLKAQADQILNGEMEDNGLLPFICRLDRLEEVDDPRMWHKANPSLRYFPTLREEMLLEYRDYKTNPAGNISFITKRMNLPPSCEENDVTQWENILAANRPLPDLAGCDCVAGIDYSKTTDFVAAGLLFLKGGTWYWMTHSWVCRQSRDLPRIKPPLEEWADKGMLTFVDGPEIPPDLPAQWLWEMAGRYRITSLGLDNFRYTLLAKALDQAGFDTDKGGANNILLTKRVTQMRHAPLINSVFANQKIAWGESPLMNWYTNNTCVATDRDGNMVYQKKEEKSRKTDGFMALVAAFCAADELTDSEDGMDLDLDVCVY